MSRQKCHLIVAALAAAAVISGCGSSSSTPATSTATLTPPPGSTAASPSRAGTATTDSSGSATTSGSTSGSATGNGTAARLPNTPSRYSQLLVDAWVKGNRAAAARVATPTAVSALFAQAPIRSLVNYSCEDDSGAVVCGYIGERDVRVELSLDPGKVSRRAGQAVTKVHFAMQ